MLRYSAKRWQPHDMYEDWSMAISSLWVISNRRAGYNHPQRVAEAATILWILIKLYDYIWLLYDIIDPFYTFLHPKSVAQAIYNNPYTTVPTARGAQNYISNTRRFCRSEAWCMDVAVVTDKRGEIFCLPLSSIPPLCESLLVFVLI